MKFTLPLLAATLAFAASHASAAIIKDDFSGATLNANGTFWATNPAGPELTPLGAVASTVDGNGNAIVTGDSPRHALVALSSFRTALGTGDLRVTYDLTNTYESYGSSGLSDIGSHYILIRSDVVVGQITIEVADGGNFSRYLNNADPNGLTSNSAGQWVIDWTPGRALITHNNSIVLDTSTTLPNSGDATWHVPSSSNTLAPYIFHWSVSPSTLVNDLVFDSVPEPASLSLLTLASLALLHRRRK